jgi:hypothetical protein
MTDNIVTVVPYPVGFELLGLPGSSLFDLTFNNFDRLKKVKEFIVIFP